MGPKRETKSANRGPVKSEIRDGFIRMLPIGNSLYNSGVNHRNGTHSSHELQLYLLRSELFVEEK